MRLNSCSELSLCLSRKSIISNGGRESVNLYCHFFQRACLSKRLLIIKLTVDTTCTKYNQLKSKVQASGLYVGRRVEGGGGVRAVLPAKVFCFLALFNTRL